MSLVTSKPVAVERPQAPDSGEVRRPVHWAAVLRLPYAARLLGATLVGRLPLGMVPVALLTVARADGRGYGTGAALASVYGLAVAAGQPLLGRLVDRRGQGRVLVAGALVSAAALLVLAALRTVYLPVAAGAVLVAGITAPPLEGSLRALWGLIAPSDRHLRAALALDSGSQELVYVTGPLAATALSSSVAAPGFAFAAAGVLGLAGALAVASSAPSRRWRPTPVRRTWLGALRSGGLRALLLVLTAIGAALGALTVASLATSEQLRAPWLSGALPAAVSVGALAGTAVWTAVPLPVPLTRQLGLSAAVFAAAWPPMCLDLTTWTALLLALLPGMAFGMILTCAYQAVGALALPGTHVEAYGWIVAAFGVGQALGTAAAGTLAGSWLLPAGAAVVALLLTLPVRRHLVLRTRPLLAPRAPSPERPS
ncbi:MFS transporter [Streptomyces sp. NPDC002671]